MGTQHTTIPSPGSFGQQTADTQAATITDNGQISMPANGWVDKVWVYVGGYLSHTHNYVFGIYRTDTSALLAKTAQRSIAGGKAWNSNTFALTSTTNNSSPSYNSPYLWLPSGYVFSCGTWADGGQDFGVTNDTTNNSGFYALNGSSIAAQRNNGALNPFGSIGGHIYYYVEYFPPAAISSITSTPVGVGQTFTITGTSFSSGIQTIDINGTNCPTYTVNSDTQLTVTVPAGALSGPVHVYTNAGSATSPTNLTISTIWFYDAPSTSWKPSVGLMVWDQPSTSWKNAVEIDFYDSASTSWKQGK